MRKAVDDGIGEAVPVQPPDRPAAPWQNPYGEAPDLVEAGMDEKRIFRMAARVAAMPVENALDGMTNEQARRNVNQVLAAYTQGLYKDQSWEGVDRIWKALTAAQLDWTMTGSQYHKNDRGVPSGKTWKFEVRFANRKQRPTTLYGIVTASGAGSVENPLEVYDLTAYAS